MLSEGMFRQLRERRVLLVALLATLVLTALFPVIAAHFGLTLLDAVADPTEARALIEGLTSEQRQAHAWITGTLDVAYPLAYGALFLGATLRFFPRKGAPFGVRCFRTSDASSSPRSIMRIADFCVPVSSISTTSSFSAMGRPH